MINYRCVVETSVILQKMMNIILFGIRKIKMSSALSSLTQWEKEPLYKHLLTPKLNSILSRIAQLTN